MSPGECREVMLKYLSCMKGVKGVNENRCREMAKQYLGCRMER
jgi:cytochrome c oxidase assembly protein subunit 19